MSYSEEDHFRIQSIGRSGLFTKEQVKEAFVAALKGDPRRIRQMEATVLAQGKLLNSKDKPN